MPDVTATWPERLAMQLGALDTDVASCLHKSKLEGPLATRLIGRRPLIPLVSYAELTKRMEIRH